MGTLSPTPPLPQVKATLKRWLEDRAADAQLNGLDALATAAGMSPNKLTICLRKPENAYLAEVKGLADALQLHWFDDLVAKWGFDMRRINLEDAAKLAHDEGMNIGLVINQAA